jgi:hypothetical protein
LLQSYVGTDGPIGQAAQAREFRFLDEPSVPSAPQAILNLEQRRLRNDQETPELSWTVSPESFGCVRAR